VADLEPGRYTIIVMCTLPLLEIKGKPQAIVVK